MIREVEIPRDEYLDTLDNLARCQGCKSSRGL